MYDGLAANVPLLACKRLIKLGVNDILKKRMLKIIHYMFPAYMLAGFFSGIIEGIILNPFELVKTRIQTDKHGIYSSSLDCAKSIWRLCGILGFWKGLMVTIARASSFNIIFFPMTELANDLFANAGLESIKVKIFVGIVCGVFASTFNTPFDVIKSRLQSSAPPMTVIVSIPEEEPSKEWVEQIQFKSVRCALVDTYKQEGLKSLYSGFMYKSWMTANSGAIINTVPYTLKLIVGHFK